MFNINDLFRYDLGIDPGSYKSRASVAGNSDIYDDFTYLTFNSLNKVVVAFGESSKEMLGRVPKGMEVIRPVQNTEIVSNVYYEMYLRNLFNIFGTKSNQLRFKTRPRVFLPLPLNHTQSSLNNFTNSLNKAGASDIVFLQKPVVAAFGLGDALKKERIKLIIDIGYQKTEIAAVYKDGIYEGKLIDFGGEVIDKYLLNKLMEEKRIQCSINNIEKYKEECLVFQPFPQENEKFKIVGKDTKKGIPTTSEISFIDFRELVIPFIRTELVKQLKLFMNSLSDRIIGDLFEEGVYLIGGSAKNKSLSKFLSKELGIKFNDIKNPDHIVLKGLVHIMNNPEIIEKIRIK